MELTAVISKVLPVVTGQGKNGEWRKQTVVIKTNGQYPKEVAFTVWGEKVTIPQPGSTVTLSFDPESREHNGNYYTELRCWKIQVIDEVAGQPEPEHPDQELPVGGDDGIKDDLPY